MGSQIACRAFRTGAMGCFAVVAVIFEALDETGYGTELVLIIPCFAFACAIFARFCRQIAIFRERYIGFAIVVGFASRVAIRRTETLTRGEIEHLSVFAYDTGTDRFIGFAATCIRIQGFIFAANDAVAGILVDVGFAFARGRMTCLIGCTHDILAQIDKDRTLTRTRVRIERFVLFACHARTHVFNFDTAPLFFTANCPRRTLHIFAKCVAALAVIIAASRHQHHSRTRCQPT